MPVVLSASGEISRIEPVTAISGRPWSRDLDGHAHFCMCDMLAGDGENGFAFGIPGDLDNRLACIDDLARVGLSRRHYAVVRRKEFGVAQLILRDAKIGFR